MAAVSDDSVSGAGTPAEAVSPEVKRYQRQKITAKLVALLLDLLGMVLLAILAGPRLGPWLADWAGASRWLQLILMVALAGVVLEVLTLPLDFYSSYVLEHRYQLSNQSLGAWIIKRLKGYLIGGLIGLPLLLGLYALIWYTGAWWWVWATLGFLAVTLVLGRLVPVLVLPLFYKITRLDNPDLEHRLQRIAAGTGLTLEGVYRLGLSAETKKANAALTGLGRTRRVLLGDTLLQDFVPEEIEVVFAHEVGHHVFAHLPKLIAWSVLTSAVGFWLVDLVVRSAGAGLGYTRFVDPFDDPAALPLVLLVLSVFGLLLSPVQNVVSRLFERQCDQYALDRTGLRNAYLSAFTKLARINKSDPDPHPLIVWLFYDHPPIRQRLALAESRPAPSL